ncbi:hypothetical protein GCK32_020097, partial [Trichostrongylus colubriformis]
ACPASVSFIDAFYNPNMISLGTPLVITAERVATMKDVMQDWRRHSVLLVAIGCIPCQSFFHLKSMIRF